MVPSSALSTTGEKPTLAYLPRCGRKELCQPGPAERISSSDASSNEVHQKTMIHTALRGEDLLIAILLWVAIGTFIGLLAGLMVEGSGFGCMGDALIGILGSVLAGLLFPALGISLGGGLIGSILTAVIGAIIVAIGIRLLRRI